MRINTSEIEIILDGIQNEKKLCRSTEEFRLLLIKQKEWEDYWIKISELEENEIVLDWLEVV